MTKAELVAAISDKSGLNRSQANAALTAFVEAVTTSLKEGQDVRLVGFGAFKPVIRKAGAARNPKTGAKVQRPACRTARFQAGESLKSALNA